MEEHMRILVKSLVKEKKVEALCLPHFNDLNVIQNILSGRKTDLIKHKSRI